MIAKRVTRRSGDHFGRLARYLAAAGDAGEKLDRLWLAGCDAGPDGEAIDPGDDPEDLELAIAEIEATQALNTRARSDKTYHLILSFRNDQPDAAALQEIERQFAAALGMEDHQRVVATHRNTENFHMHIAFNKVHPVTLRCVTPFQDFRALEATCRAVERQYGLSVDNGREAALEAAPTDTTPDTPTALSPAARDFEAHRWEVSFERHVKDLLPELEAARRAATGWQDLHAGFADHGLRLKLRGNGLVISDARGRNRIKASTLGRQFGKPTLERQLGPFEARRRQRGARQRDRTDIRAAHDYRPAPLTRHRRQAALWRRYLDQTSGRTATRKRDSLARRAFSSWKAFLLAEAVTDPLALAIIVMQRKLMQGMTLGK